MSDSCGWFLMALNFLTVERKCDTVTLGEQVLRQIKAQFVLNSLGIYAHITVVVAFLSLKLSLKWS